MVLLVVDTQEMLVTEKMYRCKTFWNVSKN